ncbi:L-2-hydroxyisocaproate dehydrogenase [Secundilactobacillus oryzae JCM 18671]|uniref:L-2-hydroxyisocaproate dehydrogenase n=1 Tax=Secundilactobacillus oryzae JCM 18671 TaxID=1291743 RepID=A0A081BGZ4_9LACO|nr:L-lactate dehydrogenase [Secundilactobacillus oryzae]GAK47312.1 L-2-hydroxyisocaproate dehydrogenase [Secundilactobacillus oryzae JCM 18671]
MRKIGLIGMGNVGATIAYTLVTKGITDELVLIDKNEKKVVADKLDLQDAMGRLNSNTVIKIQDYAELKDADILIITAGKSSAVDGSANGRMGELGFNKEVIKDMAPQIKASGFDGIIIGIMNPNDCMTQYLQEQLDYPRHKIFGTGTFLDTARMQKVVGESFGVNAKNVSGVAMGEHGASQFVAWSTVQVNGVPLRTLERSHSIDLAKLEEATMLGGIMVLQGKGYTNFAIATCAVRLATAVFADEKLACPVSAYSDDLQVYIGQPAIIGKNGVEALTQIALTAEEEQKLTNSAKVILEKVNQLRA